jgi:hypothetical protein
MVPAVLGLIFESPQASEKILLHALVLRHPLHHLVKLALERQQDGIGSSSPGSTRGRSLRLCSHYGTGNQAI